MSERVLILEHHVEQVEGGHVTYHAGSFYNIEDPLRQELIDAKKAVPESEYKPGAPTVVDAAVLAVPPVPEVAPVAKGLLDVPAPPEIAPIEVANG